MNNIANAILEEARQLSKSTLPTYSDYEYYKNILHNNGCYGYEGQLADALKL